MAFDYFLGLATSVAPAEALGALRDIAGGELLQDGDLELDEELWATASALIHPVSREAFRGTWGFDADVRIVFTMEHKFDVDARSRSEDLLAVAVARLVVRLDVDAGFDTQNDTRLLSRRGGLLTLLGDWRPWSEPEVVARLPRPFMREAG